MLLGSYDLRINFTFPQRIANMSRRTRRALAITALFFAACGLISWAGAFASIRFAQGPPRGYPDADATLALAFVVQAVAFTAFACGCWFVWILGPRESSAEAQCPKCSYSLEGHALSTCPECGERWKAVQIVHAS